MANKLTTMGYFIKRLRDSGYVVDKLFTNYHLVDARSWSVVIDPGVASVFCTCYQNDPNLGSSYFEIYDGGKFIPGRFKIDTNSIEVFISYLVKFGINHKASGYTKPKPIEEGKVKKGGINSPPEGPPPGPPKGQGGS